MEASTEAKKELEDAEDDLRLNEKYAAKAWDLAADPLSFREAEEETRIQQKKFDQADKIAKMEEDAGARIMLGVERDREIRFGADRDAKVAVDQLEAEKETLSKYETLLLNATAEYEQVCAQKRERDKRAEIDKVQAEQDAWYIRIRIRILN